MDYFSRPELSQSQLKDFMVSPAYYKLRREKPRVETEAMAIGTAVHAAVLEPEIFVKKYVVSGKIDRRTKAGKEEFEKFNVENSGKTVLNCETYDMILSMRDSVLDHPRVKDIFKLPMQAEKEIFFELEEVACKAKLDAIVPSINTVIDFKTARSASADSFKKDMINMQYDVQAFWYCEAYKSLTGKYPGFYAFIVASKEEPYPVGFFSVDSEFLDRGRYYALKALKKFKECVEKDIWPKNESDEVIQINTPEWALKEVMEFGEAHFTTNNKTEIF